MMRLVIFAAALALGAVIDRGAAAEPAELALAEDGRTRHAVVVGPGAGERTMEAARDLAEYLERISGAAFEVRAGDGATGLAVGVAGDFPALDLDVDFEPDEPFRRDDYLLRTHAEGAYLSGLFEPRGGRHRLDSPIPNGLGSTL